MDDDNNNMESNSLSNKDMNHMMNENDIQSDSPHSPGEQDTNESSDRTAEILAALSKEGYQHMRENRLSDAIQCFRTILEQDPINNYALVGIGDAYRKKRRYQESVQYYERCLKEYPKNNYALFGLADCYRNMKQFHRAIEVWETYLTLDDQNVTVLTRVADAYRKVKNLKRSTEIYEQVLVLEPGNPYAITGLGYLYYDFKRYDKALEFWMQMYDRHGTMADIRVLTSIGNCHRKLKTFEEGIKFFKEALRREPNNFYALFGLADCFRGLNQQDQSLMNWKEILRQDPHNKVILTRAGDAYRKLNDLDAAEECYRAALNVEFDTFAVLGLALIHKSRGKMQEAAESLEQLIRDDPTGQRFYPEILECYIKLGDKQAAKTVIERYEQNCASKGGYTDTMNHLKRTAGL
jgi:tetratricopeptide (TPR) repeat protein